MNRAPERCVLLVRNPPQTAALRPQNDSLTPFIRVLSQGHWKPRLPSEPSHL